jgi:hypothetical protein
MGIVVVVVENGDLDPSLFLSIRSAACVVIVSPQKAPSLLDRLARQGLGETTVVSFPSREGGSLKIAHRSITAG